MAIGRSAVSMAFGSNGFSAAEGGFADGSRTHVR
jgi:hypothetical protein